MFFLLLGDKNAREDDRLDAVASVSAALQNFLTWEKAVREVYGMIKNEQWPFANNSKADCTVHRLDGSTSLKGLLLFVRWV